MTAIKPEKESVTSSTVATDQSNLRENLLNEALLPKDSYHNGVYWADLPSKERSNWVSNQIQTETKREFEVVKSMFKSAPFSPISAYFSKYVTSGMVSDHA